MRLTTRASGFGIWMAVCATACGGGGAVAPTDAGTDTGSTDDGGPIASILPAPTQALGTTPADFACRGVATAPTPTADGLIPITMNLLSFGQDDSAENTRICFCPDNVISPEALAGTGCGACQDATSGPGGTLSLMARPGGWYAYRVFGHMGPSSRLTFLDSVQVNETAPTSAGGTVDGNAVSALTASTIPAAELITRTPGTTTIAGRAEDCDGPIRGAIIHAFHADGTEIPEGVDPGQPHYRFFDGDERPDSSATFTSGDGLYIVANVTPSAPGELIRVETWANVDGTDEMIGCEAVQIFPNGVSIVNVGPSRTDYPSGHPCE